MVSVEDTQKRKITSSIYDAPKFSVNIASFISKILVALLESS